MFTDLKTQTNSTDITSSMSATDYYDEVGFAIEEALEKQAVGEVIERKKRKSFSSEKLADERMAELRS